jgi:hypothetical protein
MILKLQTLQSPMAPHTLANKGVSEIHGQPLTISMVDWLTQPANPYPTHPIRNLGGLGSTLNQPAWVWVNGI